MATTEERMQILKMVENKQLSAEDAARLLMALEEKEKKGLSAPIGPSSSSAQGKWFHVRVTDLRTGRRKVNVTIPLGLVDVGLKMGARLAPAGIEGLDMNQILTAIRSGSEGRIVDVEDEEDNEHVEIFVE